MSEVSTPKEAPPELEQRPRFDVPTLFLDPDADLLIKSSDNIKFKVFKAFLTYGSTFFRNMFSHPQPSDTPTDEVVHWDEPARTIALLLQYIYPLPGRHESETLEDLMLVATAADKWGMDAVLAYATKEMMKAQFFDKRPFAIYAFACRLHLEDLKEEAGRRLVELYDPMDETIHSDLTDDVVATTFVGLCKLRKARVGAALDIAEKYWKMTCSQHYNSLNPTAEGLRKAMLAILVQTPTATTIISLPILAETLLAGKTMYSKGCRCISNVREMVQWIIRDLQDPNLFYVEPALPDEEEEFQLG